jgi:hypothetical protein
MLCGLWRMGLAILFFYLALFKILDRTKFGLTGVGFVLCTALCSVLTLMSEAALLLLLLEAISSFLSFPMRVYSILSDYIPL